MKPVPLIGRLLGKVETLMGALLGKSVALAGRLLGNTTVPVAMAEELTTPVENPAGTVEKIGPPGMKGNGTHTVMTGNGAPDTHEGTELGNTEVMFGGSVGRVGSKVVKELEALIVWADENSMDGKRALELTSRIPAPTDADDDGPGTVTLMKLLLAERVPVGKAAELVTAPVPLAKVVSGPGSVAVTNESLTVTMKGMHP